MKSKKILLLLYKYICNILNNNNIEFIVFYGTLLGIIRNNDFIEDDDDIDILVSIDNYEKILDIITNQKIKTGIVNESIIQLTLPTGEGPIDIYFYHKINNKDILIKWDGDLLYSQKDIFPVKKIKFKNKQILIPSNSHNILKETYGKNYLIPMKKNEYSWYNINNVRKNGAISEVAYIKNKFEQKEKNFSYNITEIYGVYFICCINNYLEIVEEQLDILQKGLLGVTTKLIIFITNYNNSCKNLDILLKKYKTKKFILVKSPDNLYEKFAINNYKNYINSTKEYYLYYFHTKGVSRINDPYFSNIRKILNFYTLEKFKINIKLLKKYDSIGCSLSLYPKKHFSGNFWWSKSSYIKLLTTINNNYLSPEMYILSNEKCNYISLANDTNYIFDKYVFRNNKDILKNITKEFIIYEQNKYLDINT